MKKWHVATAVALALPAGTTANAQLLAYSNWEAPTWDAGNIANQNNWFFSGTTNGHKVVEAGVNGAPAEPVADGGSQIHESISSANSGFLREVWGDLRDQWVARDSGNNIVHADLDFFMPASNSQDIHGITLYNTDNFILGKVYFSAFQTTAHVVSLNGTVDMRTEVTNAFTADQWNHLDVFANYDTKMFSAEVNGKIIANTPFVDTGAFGDVDLSNFSITNNSVFFTDNFRVRAEGAAGAAIPGPDSLLLFATGMGYPMMTVMRRKRLKSANRKA